MTTWTFFARVLPERIPLTWGGPTEGTAYFAPLDLSYRFKVAIHTSHAIVDITVDHENYDLPSLRNIAANHLRLVTDLVGYLKGCYFDIEVVAAVRKDTNDWHIFGIEIPVLAARRNPKDFGTVDANSG